MSPKTRAVASAAWAGFTLAGLFLYPLAAVLNGNVYYLQWQPRHLGEALAALALMTGVFACAWAAARRLHGVAGAVALAAVAAVPLLSLAVAVVAQVSLRGVLIPVWEARPVRYGVPLAAAAAALAALVARPALVVRAVHAAVVILSPVAALVAATIAGSARYEPPTVTIASPEGGVAPAPGRCRSVIAFMFDELSFSYLYDGRNVRTELGAIRSFADRATHHLAVTAPGRETLVSLPGFLAARSLDNVVIRGEGVLEVRKDGRPVPFDGTAPDGLFGTARRLGFRTEMTGYYFAYCDMLETVLDGCASYSFYNTASVQRGFSPLNPLWTTLVLWPRQFPFGLLKNPPFARQQQRLVERTAAFAAAPLAPGRPVFRLVHFSIPHVPFVFDERGFNPPADPLRTSPDDAYVRQVEYVDRLFGDLLRRLDTDPRFSGATVVLLADHGFRFGGRERDPLQIPFIVRRGNEQGRSDVTAPERGERLLRDTALGACE